MWHETKKAPCAPPAPFQEGRAWGKQLPEVAGRDGATSEVKQAKVADAFTS